MIFSGRRSFLLLLVGDLVALAFSLYIALLIRYGEDVRVSLLQSYVAPFSFLFVVSALVFYIMGLYSKRLVLFPRRVPDALITAQITNTILAALFFFFVPAFGIAPKTTLALYLFVSLVATFFWRLTLYPKLTPVRVRFIAALLARGEEADELAKTLHENPRYGISLRLVYDPRELPSPKEFEEAIHARGVTMIVGDTAQLAGADILPHMYAAARFERSSQFVEFEDLYEEVFDRVPLSRLSYEWFLKNVSPATSFFYAFVKRLIDVAGGLLMGVVTVVLVPLVFIANLFEGGVGPLFVIQDRIGERDSRIRAYKFRSMRFSDSGMWPGEGENKVTKVGSFLRLTSLDEFPQCINILRGELSLIGPRNDLVALGKRLAEALPYYNARYLVKPGITGWAQINQQYEQGNVSPQSIEETKMRLAYDFFYLKHRSLGLDIVIGLKTIKRMFFRVSNW